MTRRLLTSKNWLVVASVLSLVVAGCADDSKKDGDQWPQPPTPGVTSTATNSATPASTATRTSTGTATVTATASATRSATPTSTETATASATGTATRSETPTVTQTPTSTHTPPAVAAVCGNDLKEEGEQCDDGSICIVLPNNPSDPVACVVDGVETACPTAGDRCIVWKRTEGGAPISGTCVTPCLHDSECASGSVCEPVGGDGCAKNCTEEWDVVQVLSDDSQSIAQGISLVTIFALSGQQTLTLGEMRNDEVKQADGRTMFLSGEIPTVTKVINATLPPIAVPNTACACPRAFETREFGPGLSAVGKIGCGEAGLPNASYDVLSDHNMPLNSGQQCAGEQYLGFPEGPNVLPAIAAPDTKPEHAGACLVPNVLNFRDQGPTGSAMIRSKTAVATLQSDRIASALDPCGVDPLDETKGPDGIPCNEDDPDKGFPVIQQSTTGSTTGEIRNADVVAGTRIATGTGDACSSSVACTVSDEKCFNRKSSRCLAADTNCKCFVPCGTKPCRASGEGAPMNCSALATDRSRILEGSCIVGTFDLIDGPIGDLINMSLQCVAAPE